MIPEELEKKLRRLAKTLCCLTAQVDALEEVVDALPAPETFTSQRIPFGDGDGTLTEDSGLTFNPSSDQLTVAGDISVNGLTLGRGSAVVTNTVFGYEALLAAVDGAGQNSVIIGHGSFRNHANPYYVISIGSGAMSTTTDSGNYNNIGIGSFVLASAGSAENVAIGNNSMFNMTNGTFGEDFGFNVAIGHGSLGSATTTANNTVLGHHAGFGITTGHSNTAIGLAAMGRGWYVLGGTAGITGTGNFAIGFASLYGLTSGSNNIAIGGQAGNAITTGSGNTIIGAATGSAALTNTLILATGAGTRLTIDVNGLLTLGVVPPEHADNAAAVLAGLTNGTIYRTGDTLKIVHP
jgi:hypothetical protein